VHTSKTNSFAKGGNGVSYVLSYFSIWGWFIPTRRSRDGGLGNQECGHFLEGPAYNGLG
jgi:hypothetical protein